MFLLTETAYGEWYWFRDPLFMKHKPKKFELKSKVQELLEQETFWSYFWETSQARDDFLKNMADMSNYEWGNGRNTLIQPSRNEGSGVFHGSDALSKLGTQVLEAISLQKRYRITNYDFENRGITKWIKKGYCLYLSIYFRRLCAQTRTSPNSAI